MNRRINKILLDIIHGKKGTLESYAKLFKVSEQSIRNDVKEINRQLQKEHHTKIIFDEQGYFEMSDPVDLVNILGTFVSFQNYNLTQNERKTILALLLLTSTEYVTTYYLSEYVLVSRNTLLNDMKELRSWFERNDLTLIAHAGKGYFVKGEEIQIRSVMMKLVFYNGLFDADYDYALGFKNSIFQNLFLDIIDRNTRYKEIGDLLMKVERKNNLELADFAYQEVVCYLLILVDRCQNGHKILTMDKQDIMLASSKYRFATDLIQSLADKYKLVFTSIETPYLTSLLRSKSYIKNNSKKIDSIEIQILINELIFNLSKALNIKYYLNSDLIELLENHLQLLFYRIKQRNNIRNPMFEEVYHAYSEIFPLVKKYLTKIEAHLQTEITLHEISYIVIYLLAIMENNNYIPLQEPVRVRIVCNSGRGTAQLIRIKLKTAFPQIEIISVDSSHVLKNFQFDNQDLIISTVPIQYEKSPVLVVNPMLTPTDFAKIQKEIQTLMPRNAFKKRRHTEAERRLLQNMLPILKKYMGAKDVELFLQEIDSAYFKEKEYNLEWTEISQLSEILSLDRIRLDADATNWREAVAVSTELLLKDKLITESYTQGMIDLLKQNDSYVVISPGIAIPHADATDGALGVGASFVRLKVPINFNHKENDPVCYVIALSIPAGVNIGTCLYYFTEILASENFIEEMNKCHTKKQVLETLKNMEKKVMG